jgi:hypothetical protein
MSAHSLQTPNQMKENPFRATTTAEPLTVEQTQQAVATLYDNTSISIFPRVERKYADPVLVNQNYTLVSFVPSRDAQPDADGCFGMMKVRGVFASIEEADERAEYIIRNVDSYQSILTAFVGRPFPLIPQDGEKYGAKLNKIDIKQKTEEVISKDIKAKRQDDDKEIADMKRREENLKKDVKVDMEDLPTEEAYTTLRVKRSQLIFTFVENIKKMRELKELVYNTDVEIQEMDKNDPTLIEQYHKRYMDARIESGFTEDMVNDTDTFMKYLGNDVNLDEVLSAII